MHFVGSSYNVLVLVLLAVVLIKKRVYQYVPFFDLEYKSIQVIRYHMRHGKSSEVSVLVIQNC